MINVPAGDYWVLFFSADGLIIEGTSVIVPTLAAANARVEDTAERIGAASWQVLRCVARSDEKVRW